MGNLKTIKIVVDAVGRGGFYIGDTAIDGVVGVDLSVRPSERFNTVTFTVIGPVEVEVAVDSDNIQQIIAAVDYDPVPAVPAE